MVAKILPRYRENIKEKYMRQSYSQYLKRCILVWRYHMLGSEGYTNNRTEWLDAYFLRHKYRINNSLSVCALIKAGVWPNRKGRMKSEHVEVYYIGP